MSVDLKILRKQLRHQRRTMSPFAQKHAQQQVLNQLLCLKAFQHSKKIGVYLHAFGEIQTRHIIEYCFKQHKEVYLPMICNMNQQLHWVKITQQQYRNNRFSHHPLGMKEPMANRGLHVSTLDFLIMPLLACDIYGTRIGMGGGFYDRSLAYQARRQSWRKPTLLGLAHECQKVACLAQASWDVPLQGTVSDRQWYTAH